MNCSPLWILTIRKPEKADLWKQIQICQYQDLTFFFFFLLTSAPSSWKMAHAPRRSSGAIFRLQRLRRKVSEERSFLWNFQPIREENSQPSGSPRSLLCVENTHPELTFNLLYRRSVSVPGPVTVNWENHGLFWSVIFQFTKWDRLLTSTVAPPGALLRGRTSLLLRWTW